MSVSIKMTSTDSSINETNYQNNYYNLNNSFYNPQNDDNNTESKEFLSFESDEKDTQFNTLLTNGTNSSD